MNASLGIISTQMRLNLFSRDRSPDSGAQNPDAGSQIAAETPPRTGRTFPADEVAWGIAIRNGFDEMDDPWYHRGTTQHAYLEGNDNVAICGFRPPQSGPRTRRRSRLGMPTAGEHPMCGMCARMVVAPRPRVPIAIRPARAPVAVPVAVAGRTAVVQVTPRTAVPAGAFAANGNGAVPAGSLPIAVPPLPPAIVVPPQPPVSPATPPQQPSARARPPWVQRLEGDELDPKETAGGGLMGRGVEVHYEE